MASEQVSAIVIGGSAGAFDVLSLLLRTLPPELPAAVAVVLHLLPHRPSGLATVLQHVCALPIKEAEDKEPVDPGIVYLASPSYHLLIEEDRRFSLSVDEPVHFSRPAIDVLFESAADAYGRELCGVLLSGANQDGARGLLRVRSAGGLSAVQAPSTALARTMPEAAVALGAADVTLAPGELGPWLVRTVQARAAAAPARTREHS